MRLLRLSGAKKGRAPVSAEGGDKSALLWFWGMVMII